MAADGFVEFMLGVNDPALTPVGVFGVKSWRCAEEEDCAQDRGGKDRRCCGGKLVTKSHRVSLTWS
jgi:hypothetical protein